MFGATDRRGDGWPCVRQGGEGRRARRDGGGGAWRGREPGVPARGPRTPASLPWSRGYEDKWPSRARETRAPSLGLSEAAEPSASSPTGRGGGQASPTGRAPGLGVRLGGCGCGGEGNRKGCEGQREGSAQGCRPRPLQHWCRAADERGDVHEPRVGPELSPAGRAQGRGSSRISAPVAVGRVTRMCVSGKPGRVPPPRAREGAPVHPKLGFRCPLVGDPCSGRLWTAPGLLPAAGRREGARTSLWVPASRASGRPPDWNLWATLSPFSFVINFF